MPQYKTKMQKLQMKRVSQTQEWNLFVAIDVAAVKKNIKQWYFYGNEIKCSPMPMYAKKNTWVFGA